MPSLYAAYLRVYEPLAAFGRDEQRYWRDYLHQGRAKSTRDGPRQQRAAVWEALGAGWTRLPELPREAYVLEANGDPLICPWDLRIRIAEAALTAREGMPPVIADAFIPPQLVELAQGVMDREPLRAGRVHEQVSTWGVPLRWFVFVDAQEREVSLQPGDRLLRYRTGISKARRRAHRSLAVLRKWMGEAPITEAVEETARWLEEFHPGSVLELDYGGLVELLPDELLLEDDSPELVARGLASLASGDTEGATEAYEQLVLRWRLVQLRERAN
ncbi:MAG TPA: hypothetical protein VKZ67_11385 [Natronosporangium sp.]|nr:hypothetical protein [Natronosporangium sp.]